jgi:hypothetical protein
MRSKISSGTPWAANCVTMADLPLAAYDDRADQLRNLIDSHNRWHDIEKLAEQIPAEFARSLWPVIRDIVVHLEARPSEYVSAGRMRERGPQQLHALEAVPNGALALLQNLSFAIGGKFLWHRSIWSQRVGPC